MKRLFLFLLLSVTLLSCATRSRDSKETPSDLEPGAKIKDLQAILDRAENAATLSGKVILMTGREMVEKKKIIRGSCWDFTNAVYEQAGFKAAQRITPLRSKIEGPYADLSTLLPGDWLYFINYSFKEIDHSGIFIEWTNRDKKRGVVLSYVGGKKKKPGSYKIYDLKHVYYIIRAK